MQSIQNGKKVLQKEEAESPKEKEKEKEKVKSGKKQTHGTKQQKPSEANQKVEVNHGDPKDQVTVHPSPNRKVEDEVPPRTGHLIKQHKRYGGLNHLNPSHTQIQSCMPR